MALSEGIIQSACCPGVAAASPNAAQAVNHLYDLNTHRLGKTPGWDSHGHKIAEDRQDPTALAKTEEAFFFFLNEMEWAIFFGMLDLKDQHSIQQVTS